MSQNGAPVLVSPSDITSSLQLGPLHGPQAMFACSRLPCCPLALTRTFSHLDAWVVSQSSQLGMEDS